MAESEYILGTDQLELDRLGFQHQVWDEQLRALLTRAGLQQGSTILDLGCGPGFTSCALARFVGPTGRVIACDESVGFIESLSRTVETAQLPQIEPHVRRVEDLDLPAESLDAAYGRWILSWLPDVDEALTQVARALRPGGMYLVQEYLDWGAMKLLPRSPIFDGAMDACMQSWERGEGTINIMEELPVFARRAGFEVESFEIVARTGSPGSGVWRWLGGFFESYLPRLVERGTFAAADQVAFLEEWRVRSADETTVLVAPVVADAVLRKP